MSNSEHTGLGDHVDEQGHNKRSYSDTLASGGGPSHAVDLSQSDLNNVRPNMSSGGGSGGGGPSHVVDSSHASGGNRERSFGKQDKNDGQVLTVVFHLYVHKDVEKATLEFSQKPKLHDNLTIQMRKCSLPYSKDSNYSYLKSQQVRIHPEEMEVLRYNYFVQYSTNFLQKATSWLYSPDRTAKETGAYRKLFGGNNQYDVFKDPGNKSKLECIVSGQLFYIKMLYEEVQDTGQNLKEKMIESEHVGFGKPYPVNKETETFFNWVSRSTETGLTPPKSAFLCALLGQFYYRTKELPMLQLDLSRSKQIASSLLLNLRSCKKEYLPKSSLQSISRIDCHLLRSSSFPSKPGYVLSFCHLFDSTTVVKKADYLIDCLANEFDDIAEKVIKFILQLEGTEDKDRLIAFIVNQAPSIPSLWKIARTLILKNEVTVQIDAIVDKFEKFFSSFLYRKQDVFEKCVWFESPRALRKSIAVPFCKALEDRILKPSLQQADHQLLIDLILDKDLQDFAGVNLLKILTNLSKAKKDVDVVCNVLDAQSFCSFWEKSKKEDKEEIIGSLASNKVQLNGACNKKEEVIIAFKVLEELSQRRCLRKHEGLLAKVICQKMQRHGLKPIVDAYDQIHQTLGQVGSQWYIKLLINTVQVEQARPDVMSKLLDSIFSQQSHSQAIEIDGGREAILMFLLDQTKIPSLKSQNTDQNKTSNVINAILSEEKLLKIVFQVTGKVQCLHNHPIYIDVKQLIDKFSLSIISGDFPLGFVRKSKTLQPAIVELLTLGRCCPPEFDAKVLEESVLRNKWKETMDSLTREKENIQKRFDKLKDVIDLAKEITGENGIIILQDIDVMSKEFNDRKTRLPSTKFSDIRKASYWGPLECLFETSKELSQLSKCILFKNFTGTLLREYGLNKSKEKEAVGDEESPEHGVAGHQMTLKEVLLLLNNDGIKSFKDVFKRVTDEMSTVLSKELDTLLSDIHDIENEFKSVCEIISLPVVSSNVINMLQNYIQFDGVKTKIQAALDCLNAVGYVPSPEDSFSFMHTLQSFLKCKESGTLSTISAQMEKSIILKINRELTSDLVDTLIELSNAKELIEFIIKTAKDNMVDLIEAVEEHSDQLIQETTVSYLIDVHRFLRELLSNKPEKPETFLENVSELYVDQTTRDMETNSIGEEPIRRQETKMAAKIKIVSCNVHSLRGLHMMLSNRGEMTKEIIRNAVQYGNYKVSIDQEGLADVQLKYTRHDQNKSEAKYNFDELNDLRSRALLMVNAEKTNVKTVDGQTAVISQKDLKCFVKQVDLLAEIVRNYEFLKMSGIPRYGKLFWKKLNTMDEIKEEERRVNDEVESWNEMMLDIRHQHFFLNYFHTKQLWVLKFFFLENLKSTKDSSDEVLALFRCIDGSINGDDLPYLHSKYVKPKSMDTENQLHAIGSALKEIFRTTLEKPPSFVESTVNNKDAVVEPGKLYVGVLEPDSVQTVHVIMALYDNTCASLPKPSQLLFCNSKTTWEEIELLLSRTFQAHRHGITSTLHCIANVESLPNSIQFKLVDTLKALISESKGPYRLAIICRGGSHHHIADQFPDYVHFHGGIPDADMRKRFELTCPNIFLVTGDLPGLGKSEQIYFHAGEKGKTVVTFPISGPFVREDLVKRLSDLNLKSFQSIHFDIGDVNDPASLDTFLFELIVTKMVSSGALMFSLPTDQIYIEVANTLQQGMRNALPVCKCFKRLDVTWKDYGNIRSSNEVTSPIQVVCQYLNAYDQGRLENQEVCFTGKKKVKPLTPYECQALLKKYFCPGGDLSFNILENFLSVLADQLLKFTRSPYFKPEHLKDMIGECHNIRVRLFKALLDVSTSFAARSINTCKATQADALSEVQAREVLKKMKAAAATTADQIVDRLKGMIQWSDNQQLVIMLHGAGAITAIYRDLEKVPQNIKDLFKSQAIYGKGLEDYTKMTQDQLQDRLERFSDAPLNQNKVKLESFSYALTPDNVLKMALIIQRMQAAIPVIIMGETGCGKTSLVRYLAQTCAIPFEVFSFHAGITELQIVEFISRKDKEARVLQKKEKAVWVFLDEINTCDYLGTINEIICHRSIHGRPLASNLMFVAACNPYRLRPPGQIMTAGLTGKTTFDEFSKLVYRVHPLPETMIDYVWDYGSLSQDDEKTYIGRMVETLFDGEEKSLLVDLLATSQEFVRNEEKSSFCVSLRDVHRATILMKWFYSMLRLRPPTDTSKHPPHVQKSFQIAGEFPTKEKAIVLTLAHCYLSRLPTTDMRKSYCERMTDLLINHGKHTFREDSFQHILRAEQEDYLSRMELPEGTAKNAALRENIFVILVCILNRIPVFVVGKPGCSKSLSMQIIRSNLRGRDSKDPFLKTLPQLLFVSFQGSESSTSEGIEKVFKKARKYKNKSENVLPVVLLDEIGLAEVSKFNPLKVLHRLLEPGEGEFPDVAVVGISNWALDAAKMNRAIHLSRPEPDVDDLYDTGLSIRNAQGGHTARSSKSQIKCLAQAYHEYQSKQKHDNFHGLRDFYSMVKCLDASSRNADENSKKIQRAMQRNFGGITTDKGELQSSFLKKLESSQPIGDVQEFPVTDLIRDNLHDKMARHLMIITSGDSAIGILDQTLKDLNKEKITIFGSRFEEDLCADYNHRILSRIILCMEHNSVLILRDLENIYGSLYDMLNQNYVVVGGKKNCRVALGAFSNPMCQVDDGFRCIVLVDQNKVDYSDPPFLNRFEKQLLRFSDVLDERQRKMIKELEEWTENISSVEGHGTEFDELDMFAGFHDDTLPSIVLLHSQDAEKSNEEVIVKCKEDLMTIAMPDAVIRSRSSKLNQVNDEEVNDLYQSYFEKPIHDGLEVFMQKTLEIEEENECRRNCMKLLIMTHSSIHTDVSKCLENLFQVQTEKLSFFKSEKELSKRIKHFWFESKANLLVVQCRPETDAAHMLLVKTIIEEHRKSFIDRRNNDKHVCIVVHLRRSVETEEECSHRWQFNFLSGWSQVMIDCLEKPTIQIKEMLELSVVGVIKSETVPFHKVASDQMLWCFTRLKFPLMKPPNLEYISSLISAITSCPEIMQSFMSICCNWIENEHDGSNSKWQIAVACDRQTLINSSTLVKAMEYFIAHLVRRPLARIIFFLQGHSAFDALASEDVVTRQESLQMMSNESVFKIEEIPEAQGPESLVVGVNYAHLHFPFSSFFCKRVDTLYDFFLDEYRRQCLEVENINENEELPNNAKMMLLRKIAMKVEQLIPEILDSEVLSQRLCDYVDDFLDIKTEEVSHVLSRGQRIAIMKAYYGDKMPPLGTELKDVAIVIAQIHCNFWLEQNVIPQVFYFVKDCISMNIPCIPIENLLLQFNSIKMKDNDESSEAGQMVEEPSVLNDDFTNETNQVNTVPVENEEPIQNGQTVKFSVEESTTWLQKGEPSQSLLNPQEEEMHVEDLELLDEENVPQEEEEGEEREEEEEGRAEGKEEGEMKKEKEGEEGEEEREEEEEEGRAEGKEEGEMKKEQEGEEGEEDDEEHAEVEGEEDEEHAEVEEKREEDDDTNSEPTFEEFIVHQVCSWFLPTDNCVKSIGGIESWKTAVTLVLSSATKYCVTVPVLFYLKVCSDFASLILPDAKPYSIFALGEYGKHVEDDSYLDSPDVFKAVYDSVENQRDQGQDETKLDEFLFLFYERCIQYNPDSPMMTEILSKVSLSEEKHMLQLASSILHQILLNQILQDEDEDEDDKVFSMQHLEQLMTSETLDEFPNLMEINAVLSQIQDDEKELDCPINVICCDLINNLAFKDRDIAALSSPDDLPLKNFHAAVNVLTECDEKCKQNMFGFICAIAYIRAFISELAKLLKATPNTSSLEPLLHDVFTYLKEDGTPSRKSSVFKFLFKELAQLMCLHDVKRLVQSFQKPHLLKAIGCKEGEIPSKHVYDPFKDPAADSVVGTALGKYVESKDSKLLQKAIDSLVDSCDTRKGFAAVMMEQFYVVRSIRKLQDTEDSVAQFVAESIINVTPPYKNFITATASRQSFKSSELEISPQSSAIEFEIAVLVQHLSAILTSSYTGKSKNPIVCCLASPSVLAESHLVTMPSDDNGYPLYKHYNNIIPSDVHFFSCKCGTHFAFQDKDHCDVKCPCCHSPVKEEKKSAKQEPKETKGYIQCNSKALKHEMLHIRSLDPVEFRILHLIVHSALLAGYSLDLSIGVLSNVLKDEKPSCMCYNIIQIDLDVLCTLLCCKKENIITLLHHVLEEVSSLLTEDAGLPLPHNEKVRSLWEGYFSKKVRPVIQKFCESHCLPYDAQCCNISPEAVIEERELTQFADVISRNACVPRLFRTTQPNTFNKLREVFLNSPKDVQEQHQLLGLFLDYHDTLHLIGNVATLVSFSRRVESLLSRAITRKEAKEKKIFDVFLSEKNESQTSSKASLEKAFKEFQKSWKNVVPLINEKIQEGEKMPLISEISLVGYCLAETQDLGSFLCKSISVLAEMQNEFLDKCLAIASDGKCPALQFLCKDGSSYHFPMVHVQNAKEREVMKYEWRDNFLDHSFHETEYGQGKHIIYDMARIEKTMAGCFLLGKAYLDTNGGIREFVFSKQLFHDCANILNELCELIPQEKLPSSVEAELDSSAKKSMDRIQTLLEHMELVLCYLKRTEVNPNKDLVEYVDTWMSSSRPFPKDLLPTTINMIQIKHVCALYEFVEDLLAIPSVECVEERYLKEMLDETKVNLEVICKGVAKAVLEAVLGAIKRFVFRYLHMKPHPDECLLEFMKDPSLWPMALRVHRDDNDFKVLKAAPKFFPKEMTVGHIYELHSFYENLLKELNAKLTHPRSTGTIANPRFTRTANRAGKKKTKSKGGVYY